MEKLLLSLLLGYMSLSQPLSTLGLSFLLYKQAWLTRALLAMLAWLRGSGSWALQASSELRVSAYLPGWTAPMVFQEAAKAPNC